MRLPLYILAFACLAASAAIAQPQLVAVSMSTGTGFFINNEGYLVTNAHVVRQCQSINILTKHGERAATLVASDSKQDLAVLKATDMGGSTMAPLRWNIRDLKLGDTVYVIGFPGNAGVSGTATYKKTLVSNLEGPEQNPLWIQLGGVGQRGNSGGPVLDSTGNVIAVVSGMVQTYDVMSDGRIGTTPIGQSDIAITLSNLQEFLIRNNVRYYELRSSGNYSESTIEQNALRFTVPVRCIERTSHLDSQPK